jgi:hypothetical protein
MASVVTGCTDTAADPPSLGAVLTAVYDGNTVVSLGSDADVTVAVGNARVTEVEGSFDELSVCSFRLRGCFGVSASAFQFFRAGAVDIMLHVTCYVLV